MVSHNIGIDEDHTPIPISPAVRSQLAHGGTSNPMANYLADFASDPEQIRDNRMKEKRANLSCSMEATQLYYYVRS